MKQEGGGEGRKGVGAREETKTVPGAQLELTDGKKRGLCCQGPQRGDCRDPTPPTSPPSPLAPEIRPGKMIDEPQNGSMILYNRKKVKYRKDGYCWKKRKDGKTTREDHMKLKVQGVEVSALTRVWIWRE
ncbi:hypothetical protein NQZ68_018969 [Dissostichus eleginoides]|nr:hypothetical protein NQZ68_018969 [Dissostichus eleginoides]